MTYPSAATFGRSRIRARAPSTINLGDVFSQALRVFAGRWVGYCGAILIEIVLIAVVAAIATFTTLRSAMAAAANPEALLHAGGFIAAVVTIVVAAIAAIAVAHAAISLMAFRDATSRDASLGGAFAFAVARLPALIGVFLLYGLCVTLGLAALIIPGLIAVTIFAVAIPACIVEGLGPLASLSRSAALTKGDRWRVFGFLLVVHLGLGLASQIVIRLVSMASTPGLSLLVLVPLELLVGAFAPVALGVLYVHLRAAREGVDVEQIATVFD
jgi:uncharacterized membrane protein